MPIYSIDLGVLRISFATALVSVPAYGADRDWLVEEWRDTPQELHIDQSEEAVTITGLTGFGAEKGPHLIHRIEPPVRTDRELIAYFLKKSEISGLPQESIVSAIRSHDYAWGTLVSLNWAVLGYAPGGVEYCILPINYAAISLGFLRLDWSSVQICLRS